MPSFLLCSEVSLQWYAVTTNTSEWYVFPKSQRSFERTLGIILCEELQICLCLKRFTGIFIYSQTMSTVTLLRLKRDSGFILSKGKQGTTKISEK